VDAAPREKLEERKIGIPYGDAFDVRITSKPLLSADEQTAEWTETFGAAEPRPGAVEAALRELPRL
jgi:hypothetical protein